MKNKIKEILLNLLYSFISFALPTAVLQFVVQPMLAKELGAEVNGQYLTIMSAHYFFIGITATVLNHVRLLQQEEYEKAKICGDFNVLLLFYAGLSLLVVPLVWFTYMESLNLMDILLMILISWLYLYHDYIFAEYRLNLQYNKILINNVLMTAGYAVGYFIFLHSHRWQWIFISAYLLPSGYDWYNTGFIKEPLKITRLFSKTVQKVSVLTCSKALASVTSYCDKFILFPNLGGASVSIYYSASIVGKMLLMVSSPLNSVLLSYLVKEKSMNRKGILKKLPLIVMVIIILYTGCVLIGCPLTKYLYPDWAEEALMYIPFTVAASVFNLIASLINTILIRFYNLTYQVTIQIISLLIYIICTFSALFLWGLFGFCIAIAFSALIKMLILSGVLVLNQCKIYKMGE